VPPQLDTSETHSARVWNYLLGGKDNFAADRAAGDLVLKTFPGIAQVARVQRRFLARAVRYLAAEAGITQFLDIGTACGAWLVLAGRPAEVDAGRTEGLGRGHAHRGQALVGLVHPEAPPVPARLRVNAWRATVSPPGCRAE
jgi:hypothetical protein